MSGYEGKPERLKQIIRIIPPVDVVEVNTAADTGRAALVYLATTRTEEIFAYILLLRDYVDAGIHPNHR